MRLNLQAAARTYRDAALLGLNTLVLLLLLNFALWIVFVVRDRNGSPPASQPAGTQRLRLGHKEFFPTLSEIQFDRLLTEAWSRPHMYQPFVQYAERPFSGTFVNVSDHGFRWTANQGPWPPQAGSLNLFLFGGSTTFGYGVPDRDTVASYLQPYLSERLSRDVRVYNFGRGDYYSTQERILFEQLVASGVTPDLAVFLDGLNDFSRMKDEPVYTARLRAIFDRAPTAAPAEGDIWAVIPLVRAARGVRRRIMPAAVPNDLAYDDENIPPAADASVGRQLIERYIANMHLIEAVGAQSQVRTVFAIQPVPMFRYEDSFHLFRDEGYREHASVGVFYGYLEKYVAEYERGRRVTWCADIQQGRAEPLYVDNVHYGPKLSRAVAQCIGDGVLAATGAAK